MGWNNISFSDHPIFDGIDEKYWFLFPFILIFLKQILKNVIATSSYQHEFDCATNNENISGFNSILKKVILMV